MSKAKGKEKQKQASKPKSGREGPDGGMVPAMSVAAHPRARVHVRQAKGIGGLLGFAIAAVLSLKADVPLDQVGLRAVACGISGYLIAWACSVALWRQLVLAEIRAHQERHAANDGAEESRVISTLSPPGEIKADAGARPEPAPNPVAAQSGG